LRERERERNHLSKRIGVTIRGSWQPSATGISERFANSHCHFDHQKRKVIGHEPDIKNSERLEGGE